MEDKNGPTSQEESPQPDVPPPATPAQPSAAAPDKLAPFRALFGMPVAVQFAGQTPYIQIAPLTDNEGNVQVVQVPGGSLIGLPSVALAPDEKGSAREVMSAVAVGVLQPSDDGTWLIIEERLSIPRTGTSPGGQALMDVYVRPELVTHISFVKSVEFKRPNRALTD